MKTSIMFVLGLALLFIPRLSWAICGGGSSPEYSNSSTPTKICVGSSPVDIMIFDGTRIGWNIHPEGANVRCVPGYSNGKDSSLLPSSTVGQEFLSNGYFDNCPTTNPILSMNCASESGSSVCIDVWTDNK